MTREKEREKDSDEITLLLLFYCFFEVALPSSLSFDAACCSCFLLCSFANCAELSASLRVENVAAGGTLDTGTGTTPSFIPIDVLRRRRLKQIADALLANQNKCVPIPKLYVNGRYSRGETIPII